MKAILTAMRLRLVLEWPHWLWLWVLALGAALLAFGTDVHAATELVNNGSFETNNGATQPGFTGWTTVTQAGSSGSFFAQTGTLGPVTPVSVPAPPVGSFAAMSDQTGPASTVMYQDLALPTGQTANLYLQLYIQNQNAEYFMPSTLDYTEVPNQQVRVDIMDPSASVFDVGSGVLQNLFITSSSTPQIGSGYMPLSADLSARAGSTIRLRIAVVSNQQGLNAGVDGVSLQVGPVVSSPVLSLYAGTPQTNPVNQALPAALVTKLTSGGSPVAGAVVTFAAPGSGASGTFAGNPSVVTDANGLATAPVFTSNGTAGSYAVAASQGAASVNFALTNVAAGVASITGDVGTPQTAVTLTPFPQTLQALVRDASNAPISGVVVTFTIPAGSNGMTFKGGATSANATTDANGHAVSPVVMAGSPTALITVLATTPSVSNSAAFNLAVTPPNTRVPVPTLPIGGLTLLSVVLAALGLRGVRRSRS